MLIPSRKAGLLKDAYFPVPSHRAHDESKLGLFFLQSWNARIENKNGEIIPWYLQFICKSDVGTTHENE